MATAYEAFSSGQDNTATIAPTRPAGASNGARALLWVSVRASYTITAVDADWTLVSSIDAGIGADPFLLLYEFTNGTGVLDSADTGPWSFTRSSATGWHAWLLATYTGTDGTIATPVTTDTGVGTSHVATGMTVPGAGDLMFPAWAINSETSDTWTIDAGVTEIGQAQGSSGTLRMGVLVGWEKPGAGATGTRTSTFGVSESGAALVTSVAEAASAPSIAAIANYYRQMRSQ